VAAWLPISAGTLREPESDELAHRELGDETESLLDRFHGHGRGRGFKSAPVVGTSCDGSDWLGELVAGISQRLVLDEKIVLPPD